MKKLYTVLLSLGVATSITAQQLPNSNFDGTWGDCTPWTSNNNKSTKGQTPENWTISHVIGMANGMGATEVGKKVDGHSGSAVEIHNEPNPYKSSQIVPGYITLGTSWATSVGGITPIKNMDGGSFGGINFTYRPDAVEFYYQRTHGTANASEVAMVIAYSWKGTTTQVSVPGNNVLSGSPATATMTDRDRNILGKTTSQGGAVTTSSDFALISKIEKSIEGNQTSWTRMELPFEYSNNAAPEKFNIIFSAGDYYSTTPGKANTMSIDEVKLLYFSRLASLSVNGQEVNGFSSDKYEYTVNGEMPAAGAFNFTTLGTSGSANATLSLDTANSVATIKVTNSNVGGTDVDGATEHTYTIRFVDSASDIEGQKYDGTLIISTEEDGVENVILSEEKSVYINKTSADKCTVTLPDFAIDLGDGPLPLGDIIVSDTDIVTKDGVSELSGDVKHFSLLDGDILANIRLSGTEIGNELDMIIFVDWIYEDEDEGDVTMATFKVTFNGTTGLSGISTVGTDSNVNAPVNYYNLNGVEVEADNLTPGIYVIRQGNQTQKVLVK
ncbi:MAG: PCMD domain-containing protein [Paramuribaculum sp.]|nr:PCMD domain-containing protein [Paramuribaculum sp.]